MAYNQNIPQPSDVLSGSQPQILENFSQLNSQFGVDHSKFDPTEGTGKHKKVTVPEFGGSPTTGANEGVYYSKSGPLETEPYFRTENNGLEKALLVPTAWVYFNGATGAIIKTHNIASVTRSSAGRYVINFNPGLMLNADYLAICSIKGTPGNEGSAMTEEASIARTINTFPCICAKSGAAIFDPLTASVVFFGGRR